LLERKRVEKGDSLPAANDDVDFFRHSQLRIHPERKINKQCYTSGEKLGKSMRFFASLRMTPQDYPSFNAYHLTFLCHPETVRSKDLF
jgi:hypothetical protein